MTNNDVVQAWLHHRLGHSNTLRSDGEYLWSYALLIGGWSNGKPNVRNYTATAHRDQPPLGFVSMTTSHHVGLAYRAVDSWRAEQARLKILDTQ